MGKIMVHYYYDDHNFYKEFEEVEPDDNNPLWIEYVQFLNNDGTVRPVIERVIDD